MDLRSLRHFLAVADKLSFSRAAQALHRSQPGLSRSIRELEAEFGMALFERSGRHVALRPDGELLVGRVRQLLDDADRLLEVARLLASGRKFILRLGCAANTLERALPEVLRLYHRDWSNVDVQLRSEGGSAVLAALERGELDVGIARATHSDLLQSKVAFPTHVIAILGRHHRLASQRSLRVEQLQGERLLVPPPSFTSRMLLDTAFGAANFRPYIALESHDLNTLVALAEAGQGVALTPSTVATEARDVAVLSIQHAGRPLGTSTSLIWARQRSLPPYIEAFIDVAARHLKRDYPGRKLRLPPLEDYRG